MERKSYVKICYDFSFEQGKTLMLAEGFHVNKAISFVLNTNYWIIQSQELNHYGTPACSITFVKRKHELTITYYGGKIYG